MIRQQHLLEEAVTAAGNHEHLLTRGDGAYHSFDGRLYRSPWRYGSVQGTTLGPRFVALKTVAGAHSFPVLVLTPSSFIEVAMNPTTMAMSVMTSSPSYRWSSGR